MQFDVHRCFESGERIAASLILHVLTCLLFKLVEKDKDARLCCKGGIAGLSEIRKMPWFSGIDWELLEAKKITPPMRPNVSLPAPPPSPGIVIILLDRVRETLTPLMSSKRSSWKITHCGQSGGQKTLIRCPRR